MKRTQYISASALFSGFTAKAYGGDFWEGARQGATTSALNHLSHSFSNDIITQIENRQNGERPTMDKGGFVSSDQFYDYMLEQAKNNPVEVAAFELQKGNTGETKYFVLPWKNNTANKSRFSMNVSKYVDGYTKSDIRGLYHTHPKSTPPSGKDQIWSDKYNLPIYSIGANGTSYIYLANITSPIDLRTLFKY